MERNGGGHWEGWKKCNSKTWWTIDRGGEDPCDMNKKGKSNWKFKRGRQTKTKEVGSNETIKFRYIGVGLKQEEEAIIMDQKTYIEEIGGIRRNNV